MKAKKLRKKLRQHEDRLAALELIAAARILSVDMDPAPPLTEGPTFDTGGWALDDDDGWRRFGVYL